MSKRKRQISNAVIEGEIKQCIFLEANDFVTPYGTFVPQYADDGYRRKRVKPVIFHENGNIKNLPLQNKAIIKTTVGNIPAELITWYDNSSIRRIFPLDGGTQFKPSLFNLEGKELHPLRLGFSDNKVRFNNNPEYEFNINECSFTVKSLFAQKVGACSSCGICSGCK